LLPIVFAINRSTVKDIVLSQLN